MSDQTPAPQQPGTLLPNVPGAVPALVLGIIGAALCWCYGIGLVPSIIALVLGVKARKAFAANQTQYQGGGMATAGMVLGIVGTVLGAIFVVVYVFVIIAAIQYGGSGGLFDFYNYY